MPAGDPIRRSRRNRVPEIKDDLSQRIFKELERQGLARVPGLPDNPQWYDLAIELERRHQQFEAEREEARPRKEEEEQAAPLTGAAGALSAAIAGGDDNAQVRESIASVISRGLSEILEGRNE